MNRWITLGMALVLHGVLAAPGYGQRPASTGSGVDLTARSNVPKPSDMLRPYGSRDAAKFFAEKQTKTSSRPAVPPRPVERSRAAVFARGVPEYYPQARNNQQPNRNVIDPKSLCVPGRRAMLQR